MDRVNSHGMTIKMAFVKCACQYDGRFLVLVTVLVETPSRDLAEKLPLYLGFFEFVHNMKKRGKALLECLIKGVLGTAPWNPS